MTKLHVEHRNSFDLAIDKVTVEAGSEREQQTKLKNALMNMIKNNVLEPGDSFAIVEA